MRILLAETKNAPTGNSPGYRQPKSQKYSSIMTMNSHQVQYLAKNAIASEVSNTSQFS